MSNQRNSNPRYGTGTVSGNLTRPGGSGPSGGPQPFQKGYGSGMVSLGTAKKPRAASTLPERKLAVPKPVNLPSLRKENAGNDPNTQLVPSGGVGGWQKPEAEEKPEEELVPNLTAGSSWASAPSASGVPSWQPPQPFPVAASGPQKARNLNPLEYPSLSAAATAQKQTGVPIQPVPHLPSSGSQGGGNWDEDERKPVFGQSKASTESWADSKVEDEKERSVYRPPWEQNGHARDRPSDDHWSRSSRPGFGSKAYDRFKEVDDPHLFPPPPPPRQPPPPPPRAGEPPREELDAEKRAFEDEIDRVMEEERTREREALRAAAEEAARQKALEEEAAAQAAAQAAEQAAQAAAKAAAETEAKPLSAVDQQAALEAARQKALAARKRREAEDEELEKKRKEAAFAKLKELEERMQARAKAEQDAKDKLAAAQAEQKSAEQVLSEVGSALNEAAESSAESAVTAAKLALEEEIRITQEIEQFQEGPNQEGSSIQGSLESRGDLASVQADAGSSVALSEHLDTFKSTSGAPSDTSSGPDLAQLGNKLGQPSQPKAIWQRRNKGPLDSSASESHTPAVGSLSEAAPIHRPDLGFQQPGKEDTGAAALFNSRSSFGPSLVANSMGISTDDLSSAQQRTPRSPAIPDKSDQVAPGPTGPLNWRAVMGVKDIEEPDFSKTEEIGGRSEGPPGRGRGRGRNRERLQRDDSQDSSGRGRGNRDRGRGRGRARGRLTEQSSNAESSELGEIANQVIESYAPEGGRRASRGRGRGRGELEGRGRGRGRGREQFSAGPPPPPPPPPPPALSDPKPVTNLESIISDELPPGMFPSFQDSIHRPQGLENSPSGLGTSQESLDWSAQISQETLPPRQNVPIGKPSALDPPLDSFGAMNIESRHDKPFDRPVDRPKSAAGAVGQPISKLDSSLANGMPNLPHDLSLGSLGGNSKPVTSSGISYGFQASQQSLAPGPFPGVYFSGQHQNNPWQPRASEPNLSGGMAFYKGPSGTEHPSPRQANQQGPSGLQFGAFGAQSFPQFGQLGNPTYDQATPFIHTGKQPDWSIGPSLVNSSQNTGPPKSEPPTTQPSGPDFSRSVGIDAIVQPSSLNKRGPQSAPGHPSGQGPLGPPGPSLPGPPGPPGLQRNVPQSNQQQSTASLPGDLFSSDPVGVKSPPPPPGLQNPSAAQTFYNPNRTPRAFTQQGGSYGPSQINVSFSAPPQQLQMPVQLPFQQAPFQDPPSQQLSQGPPPGIGKSSLTPRSQVQHFPEDVFDSSTLRVDSGFLPGPPQQVNSNQQGGRGGPGRGSLDARGGRISSRGPARGAPMASRGRGFGGRMPNIQPGRGPVGVQPNLGILPNQGFQHPGMPGVIGSGPSQAFPLQQGGMGSMGGFGPAHGPVGDQMQGQRLNPSNRGRGRGGLRTSHDGSFNDGRFFQTQQ